ncbi:MAG: hypothetical protein ACTHMM_05530 [Agriterribacter sp.]
MPKLKETIHSSTRSLCYGLAGDIVTIIADHGNVMIVESKVGNRFPVRREQLVDDEVKVEPPAAPKPVPPPVPAKKARSGKRAAKPVENKNQKTLFG